MTTTIKAPDIVPSADLLDLTDPTAIVTGGAMGIGLGIVRRRHEAGASVVIADLDWPLARRRRPRCGTQDLTALYRSIGEGQCH